MRSVSILEVADPAAWAELEAVLPLDALVEEVIDARKRVVSSAFADELAALGKQGIPVLERFARRPGAEAIRHAATERIATLRAEPLRVLYAAQRHAADGVVRGFHAWDPVHDAEAVRTLHAAGLLGRHPEDAEGDYTGRFTLPAALPPPPARAFDFEEAVMPETDDLPEDAPGPAGLLQDMAGLAAALSSVGPKRTHAGTVSKADARRLGRRLGVPDLAADGVFEDHPRWVRALQGLEALGAVAQDPIERRLFLDLGVDELLGGTTQDAISRLIRRLIRSDLHPALDAIQAALAAAGDGGLDEAIVLELLHDQARDLLFPCWITEEGPIYPRAAGETARAYDDLGWERVEERLIEKALRALDRLGLIRRAPGIFAASADGRAWAGVTPGPTPSLWAGSDLEIVIPPGAVTPWERFQLERLTRCVSRDVVDRHVLERPALLRWLATHDLDEALSLLERRCLAVPPSLVETLTHWARAASRITLTRGVLLP